MISLQMEDSNVDPMSFLLDMFGETTRRGPPPTEEELKETPEITTDMKTGGRKTLRNKTTGGDLVSHLLMIRNQVKLYHWQTGSFARHKASDDLTSSLDDKIDHFVEVFMGKYGRPKVSGSIKLHNFSEAAAKSFVANEREFLTGVLPKKISKDDSDLLNIRDEILGELNKVLYLFSLA